MSAADGAAPRVDVGDDPPRVRLPVVQPTARVRPRTLSMRRQSKRELARIAALYPDAGHARPATRGECEGEEGPCPWVSCKHNLYLDVNEHNGNIKLNFPDREVWEIPDLCALHVADRGGVTLEEIGDLLNLTRERIRQIEDLALARLKGIAGSHSIADFLDERSTPLPSGAHRESIAAPRVDWFAEAGSVEAAPEVEAAWAQFTAAPVEAIEAPALPVLAPAVASPAQVAADEVSEAAAVLMARLRDTHDHYRDEADAEIARLTEALAAMQAQRDAAEAEVGRMLRGVSEAHAMKARLDRVRRERDEARALVGAAMAAGLAECERLRAAPVAPVLLLDEEMFARVVAAAAVEATRGVLRAVAA